MTATPADTPGPARRPDDPAPAPRRIRVLTDEQHESIRRAVLALDPLTEEQAEELAALLSALRERRGRRPPAREKRHENGDP